MTIRLLYLALFFLIAATSTIAEVRVGATLSLTGTLASVGQDEADGLKMALEEPRDGQPSPQLLLEDNQGTAREALSGVQKLINESRVDLLISAYTHITQAVKGAALASGTPLIYISTLKSIAAESPLFFRDYWDIDDAGSLSAKAIVKKGWKRVVYLRDSAETSIFHERSFERSAQGLGIQVLGRWEYSAPDEIKPLLLKIRTHQPEAIVICTLRDTVAVMRGLSDLRMLNIPTVQVESQVYSANDTPEMRELYEKNQTVSVWYGYAETTKEARVNEFRRGFRTRFGRDPRPDALYAYDLGRAIRQVAASCRDPEGELDRSCFLSKLGSTSFQGVSGEWRFDGTRNSTRSMLLTQVRAGQWYEIESE